MHEFASKTLNRQHRSVSGFGATHQFSHFQDRLGILETGEMVNEAQSKGSNCTIGLSSRDTEPPSSHPGCCNCPTRLAEQAFDILPSHTHIGHLLDIVQPGHGHHPLIYDCKKHYMWLWTCCSCYTSGNGVYASGCAGCGHVRCNGCTLKKVQVR